MKILQIPGMSRRDFLKLTGGTAATLASTSLVMELLAACTNASTTTSSTSRTLTIGIAGEPDTLDPEFGQSSRTNELIKNRYAQWSRYATVDAGGGNMKSDLSNIVGEALESFSVDPDGVTVHLKVRQANVVTRHPVSNSDFRFNDSLSS